MKNNYKQSVYFLLLLFVFTGCHKVADDWFHETCDVFELTLHNHSQELAIFAVNNAPAFDTLYPGDQRYYQFPNSNQTPTTNIPIHTTSGSSSLYLTECATVMDAPNGANNFTQECGNSEYNPETGELGIDCGGACKPCLEPTFSCNIEENKLQGVGSILTHGVPLDSSTVIHTDSSTVITFFINGNQLVFDYNKSSLYYGTKRYETSHPTERVALTYYISGLKFKAGANQHFYIVKENNKLFLRFCDLDFNDYTFAVDGSAYLEIGKTN